MPQDALPLVIAVLAEFCGSSSVCDLASQIEVAAKNPQGNRASALFLIRCLGVPGAIPEGNWNDRQHIHRKLVELVEQTTPDIADYFRLGEKKQTVDKIETLRDVHRQCVELLEVFSTLPSRPEEFASRRQDIFRALNNKFLKSYLNNYDFVGLSSVVRAVVNDVCDLLETSDATFGPKLQHLMEKVQTEIRGAETRFDFLAARAFLPFLRTALDVVNQIEKQSSDRFKCALRSRRNPPKVVERRYRLHEPNQIVRVNYTACE
ncbi:MAG: hypothetical protein ACREC1_06005 [Methylovirgula sp.]